MYTDPEDENTMRLLLALFGLAALVLGLMSLSGCSLRYDPQAASDAANAQREVGHASPRTLVLFCDYEAAERLPTPEARQGQARELTDRGCEVAWQAQRAFALAHRAQVRALEAAERGECLTTTPRSSPACRPLDFAAATYEAGIALADAIAAVRAVEAR